MCDVVLLHILCLSLHKQLVHIACMSAIPWDTSGAWCGYNSLFTFKKCHFIILIYCCICTWTKTSINPFTPKSDQSQISPAASPEILHHTVWRTWLFIAYSDERLLHYQFSLPHPYISLEESWENVLFELGSERVKIILTERKPLHPSTGGSIQVSGDGPTRPSSRPKPKP